MQSQLAKAFQRTPAQKGVTLLELIMAISILIILSTAALPAYRFTVVREKESELRHNLREIRDAIDRYKDLSDKNLIRAEFGSDGYPKDLETLVKGVQFGTAAQRVRFLRRIPVDPMTGHAKWRLQSQSDDPDSQESSGANVFDIHSESQAHALDGTPYSKW
jgi:general secretion pathway protein G